VSNAACAQDGYGIRFEWGPEGAARVGGRSGTLVIVDVLSFTTAVGVAVERGVAVYPARPGDDMAAALAQEVGAALAVDRRQVTEKQPWSLSPAGLRLAPAPARLELPSPNGSAIAATARGDVVAASLRNARAVAAWLDDRGAEDGVTVVAAGERWPDGSLRPALEDLLGAGAVLSALDRRGVRTESPEAAAARRAYESSRCIADDIRSCMSGEELVAAGFAEDVDVAVEADASQAVPVLLDGAFRGS
jgi:2-phosphosulfolactate phosphatase